MRVAIITFNGINNYGTALQELALNKAVKKCGHDPITISYFPSFIKNKYSLKEIRRSGIKKYIVSLVGWCVDRFRIKKFEKFRRNFSHTKWMYRNEILQEGKNYDFYLVGSDQIWNYEATGFDTTFFLDFVSDKSIKASYAASIGLKDISAKAASKMVKFLKDMKVISVREKTGQDIIKEKMGLEAELVLDPTLLLTKEEWETYFENVKMKKKYIFVYQVGFSKTLLDFARRLAKNTGCTLVFVPLPMGSLMFGKWKFNIGPGEWLSLLKNAECVVTDSYHATLFSINFNKNFYVETCKTDMCMGAKTGSRIYDILTKFSLTDRLISDVSDDFSIQPIDYTEINHMLQSERIKSFDFLERVLNTNECL